MKKRAATIRWKIMKYFLCVVWIMAVSLVMFYQVSVNNITRVTVESMENILANINLETYNTLHEVQEIAALMAKDSEIQQALRGELPKQTKDMYGQRMDFNSKIWYMNRYIKDVSGMYVVGENGAQFRSGNSSMLLKDFREEEWYKTVKEEQEPLWSCQNTGSFMVRDLDEYMISIVTPIIDRASYRFLGAIVVDVAMGSLRQISKEGMVFDGILMLLGEENKVLYSDDGGSLDKDTIEGITKALSVEEGEKQQTREIRVESQKYLVSDMNLDISDWKIVGLVSDDVIYNQLKGIRSIMFLAGGCCICLSVILAVSASKGISKPILTIRSVMRKVEKGDLEAHVDIKQKDEVGELADSFNHMVDKLDILVKDQKQSQEKLRMAELKALQAQITPHFLYNTLDSINWMARAGQIDSVGEMINSLSIFFRISLSKGRTFIKVEEELRHVENYILIQKKRYEKYLDYVIEVPENIREYQCLKMILQPLVENGIYHGIKEKGERGLIRISAREEGNILVFQVEDTGKGMTEEKLRELQEMMKKGIEYDANAYGVINVQRRIQTYFGEEYGLHFESVQNRGTVVTVVIPRKNMQEDGHELESSDHRG